VDHFPAVLIASYAPLTFVVRCYGEGCTWTHDDETTTDAETATQWVCDHVGTRLRLVSSS
jgi:hypothetical protein